MNTNLRYVCKIIIFTRQNNKHICRTPSLNTQYRLFINNSNITIQTQPDLESILLIPNEVVSDTIYYLKTILTFQDEIYGGENNIFATCV